MLIATEPEINIFKTLLQEYTGFNFPKGLDREFNTRLERALSNTSLSLKQFLYQFQAAATPQAAFNLLAPLLNELLIGETYFWRDPEIFESLRKYVLPELVKRKADFSHLLRVWSAACSTGEEIYSLAILLRRYFKDTNWLLSLVGSDINENSLEIARKAEYGDYSLRGNQQHQNLLECFDSLPQVLGRRERWKVKAEYRAGVRFQNINLASPDYPSPANDTCNYDIIFCRNIFIYFTPELAAQIINRLFGALNEGGFLIVSPCEYSPQFLTRFEAVQAGSLTLYRRPLQFGKWEAPIEPNRITHASPTFYKSQPATLTYPPMASSLASKVTPAPSPARLLEQAREAFAAGQFEQARELALKTAAQDALLAESYLLLSSLYHDAGQLEQALEMARRFVYLEPDRPEGQFFLAKLQHALGLQKRAAQAYRRLLELLGNLHSGLLFPYLAGLSVKELRQLAQQNLSALETC